MTQTLRQLRLAANMATRAYDNAQKAFNNANERHAKESSPRGLRVYKVKFVNLYTQSTWPHLVASPQKPEETYTYGFENMFVDCVKQSIPSGWIWENDKEDFDGSFIAGRWIEISELTEDDGL